MAQSERVRKSVGGTIPKRAATDRGFRGIKEVEGTTILLPSEKKTRYGQQVARLRFQARAAIEPLYLSFKKKPLLKITLPERSGCRYK